MLRGWAYADGKLIYNLLDDHTVAVDAQTGKEVWRVKLDDVSQWPDHDPGGLCGRQQGLCRQQRRRDGYTDGWFQALDVKDGHTIWKAHDQWTGARAL